MTITRLHTGLHTRLTRMAVNLAATAGHDHEASGSDSLERALYVPQPVEHDDYRAMERSGTAPSNFTQQLPSPDSARVQQVAKYPNVFEFLGLAGRC